MPHIVCVVAVPISLLLGLAVHCSGDFINPGWRGRMPLQLINHGANTIRLVPYLPICQLTLVKLSSQPDRLYGDRTLSSKYVDDDGGPSYWWRDKLIRRLQTALGNQDVTSNVQDELITYLGSSDFPILDRFERCIRRLPHSALTNADDLLRNFAQAEDRQASRTKLIRAVGLGAGPALLTVSLGSLFSQPFGNKTYGGLHFTLWGLAALALLVSEGSPQARRTPYRARQGTDVAMLIRRNCAQCEQGNCNTVKPLVVL